MPTASVKYSGRNYPLREILKSAWASVGVHPVADLNSGSPLGLAEAVEARNNGFRVITNAVYPLNGVKVITNSLVKCVLLEKDANDETVATGAELENGRTYFAKREVIVSAGAIRTPQLLMLSGIGPAEELTSHGIKCILNSPEVGKNLWDHVCLWQFWKLRHPELGGSIGSSFWTDPSFIKGNPIDWIVSLSVPAEGLKAALSIDKPGDVVFSDNHSLLSQPRCHIWTVMQYVGVNIADPPIPMDGSHVTTSIACVLPTSRGTITLKSADAVIAPVIDPNYHATEADRYVVRQGAKKVAQVLCETLAGQEMILSETVPEGYEPISSKSKDEEIDKRFSHHQSSR